MDKKEIVTTTLLNKDVVDKNQIAFGIVSYYSKAMEIIERTRFAMGRKASFKVSTSSTMNEKLNTNVFAATH